ncbi:short-chain dehydrogenase [Mycobacterium rhizamassiliense]|uniref:Short-chain dehydrogenase n=1 Tax=Mycobacterium rhizamassiliense TaxID=1841860 RepID=A0A2U3P027_9MYCO|nr:SDR family oxidoreductase [Mycobacterium rhizamassiliense]SPM37078.1 short-chain dehydrogenase [Mycobacterium rhizamassiliense]
MTVFTNFDDVKEGETASLVKTITDADIRRFVELTGDDNPLHVDAEYANHTPFKEIVVHGMLGASFVSTVIGTKLPGPGALWVSQSFDFSLPVRLGDTLTVSCTVVRKHVRDRLLELEMRITNQHGQAVLVGQGKVKLLEAPKASAVAPKSALKAAIVTGGGGGIGSAICEHLATDGYSVVVNYLNSRDRADALVRQLNAIEPAMTRAVAVQADVSTAEGCARLNDAAQGHFGGVSALINAASPRIVAKPLAQMSWADMQQHLDVQVKSAFLAIQAVAPAMAANRGGRIVCITSESVDGTPVSGWTAYATAKGALATMSRYLAAELGPHGVTVNCVSPGMTDTRFISGVSEKQQLVTARLKPLRRLGTPADVAGTVAFLLSDQAAYITGQSLKVNGGGTMS